MKRKRRESAPKLPAPGARYLDAQGVRWRVATVHDGPTPRVTVEAHGLRRTMSVERLHEQMERER